MPRPRIRWRISIPRTARRRKIRCIAEQEFDGSGSDRHGRSCGRRSGEVAKRLDYESALDHLRRHQFGVQTEGCNSRNEQHPIVDHTLMQPTTRWPKRTCIYVHKDRTTASERRGMFAKAGQIQKDCHSTNKTDLTKKGRHNPRSIKVADLLRRLRSFTGKMLDSLSRSTPMPGITRKRFYLEFC